MWCSAGCSERALGPRPGAHLEVRRRQDQTNARRQWNRGGVRYACGSARRYGVMSRRESRKCESKQRIGFSPEVDRLSHRMYIAITDFSTLTLQSVSSTKPCDVLRTMAYALISAATTATVNPSLYACPIAPVKLTRSRTTSKSRSFPSRHRLCNIRNTADFKNARSFNPSADR